MSTSAVSTQDLDIDIQLASIALGGAREQLRRCPSGENVRRVEQAEAEVDRLLDQRLAVG